VASYAVTLLAGEELFQVMFTLLV